jgi:formamidopyrimidine-DNA glycosylase
MPELPDLLYIRDFLRKHLPAHSIRDVIVKQPILLRNALSEPIEKVFIGKSFTAVDIHGPFLRFPTNGSAEMIVNLMLAGRLQIQQPSEKPEGYLALSFGLEGGTRFNICDSELMAKVYVVPQGDYAAVPAFTTQGIDVLSDVLTPEFFAALAKKNSRKQVRVFINDHTQLSSIGNAYADEILFEARLHPKTIVAKLTGAEIVALHGAILSVLRDGIRKVAEAGEPIQVKVRDHLKVRNRHGEPCPRCGTTIRRAGVRGHDVFFCPKCQPATRKGFVNWDRTSGP